MAQKFLFEGPHGRNKQKAQLVARSICVCIDLLVERYPTTNAALSAAPLSGVFSDLLNSNVKSAGQKHPESRSLGVPHARRNFVDASATCL